MGESTLIRIAFLLAAEDRIWNMKRALRQVEKSYPGLVQGKCYSVRALATKPELIQPMLDEVEDCDFAIVYFHGGAQVIPGFLDIWGKLTARIPVYFESSLPEEISELLPTSGLSIEEYQVIRGYFSLADDRNFTSLLLHIAKSRSGVDCEVPQPNPPQEEGFYTRAGILDYQQSEKLRCMAAQTENPVVGLILHQSHVRNGNTRHMDATFEKLDEMGAIALPLFTGMPNDEDEKLGIR